MTQQTFDLDMLPAFGPSDLVELLGVPFSLE